MASATEQADEALNAEHIDLLSERQHAFSAFDSRPFTLFWSTIILSLTGV